MGNRQSDTILFSIESASQIKMIQTLGTLGIDLESAPLVRHLYVHVYFIHHKE